MNISALKREYKMSDSELALFADDLVTYMTRDTTEFADRGVDGTAITALQAKEDEFEAFPTDQEYLGLITIAVAEKEAAREALESAIRNISDRAMLKWGSKSGQYKRFDVKGLTNMRDRDMHFCARRVHRVGTEYLTALTPEGLTQAMLDDLDTKTEDYETKLNAIQDSEAVRDTKAEERVVLGNELYELVVKYCEIGKVIWKESSEAKYNDYVIYKTIDHGLSKPQNLTVEYVGGSPAVNHLGWDAVTDATSYDVYVSIRDIGAPSGDYNLLNNFTDVFADVPPVDNKRNYYKIKAKNDEDTSDYSEEAYVDVEVS